MRRKDLELPSDIAEMVARRQQLARAPDAAKARLHRRLAWAFTDRPEQPEARHGGLFQRLMDFRLVALPAALVTYLPLAVAGIGFGAASLSIVYVLSRRAESPAHRQVTAHRVTGSPHQDPYGVVPVASPLDPLPEAAPTPESIVEPAAEGRASPPIASPPFVAEAPPMPSPRASLPPPGPTTRSGATPSASPAEPARDVSRRKRPSTIVAPALGAPPPGLVPELERQLLEQARAQLRSGAIFGALATLDQHRALYPGSQLSEEREVLVIEATVRSRGLAGALPMVESFRQRFPRSPLLPALESFLKSNQSQPQLKGVP